MTTLPANDTTLYIIRHGETAHNAAGRLQGHVDVALAERGRRQAAAAALVLRGRPIAGLYSSDLLRARQTAEIIGDELGLPVKLEPRLREVNVGEWGNLTAAEIQSKHPEVLQQMRRAPEQTRYPGGESYGELADRVMAALTDIANAHASQAVAVVTHGGALRAIMSWQLGYGWAQRDRFTFENCGVLQLVLAADGPRFMVPAPGLA